MKYFFLVVSTLDDRILIQPTTKLSTSGIPHNNAWKMVVGVVLGTIAMLMIAVLCYIFCSRRQMGKMVRGLRDKMQAFARNTAAYTYTQSLTPKSLDGADVIVHPVQNTLPP